MGLHAVLSGDNLKLSYDGTGIGVTKISLVNCAGRNVFSSIEDGGGACSRTISLRNMHRGVYFVTVEQNAVKTTVPFTICR